MTVDEAIRCVNAEFPFKGYVNPGEAATGAHSNIAHTAIRYLEKGAKILDFGCGPCDKTAVLQLIGFNCSAYDDLQDDWHKILGNREKIMLFAHSRGIDFRLANQSGFPFDDHSFDMIMLHDVLEHLHDSPRDLLNNLLKLAKPEALLFITVPNAVNIKKRLNVLLGKTNLPPFNSYYWYPGPWRGHIREYVKNDLLKLSEYLNLAVMELRGCDHMLQKIPGIIKLPYLLITSIFDSWKDSWLLVARKRKNWSAQKTLPRNELVKISGEISHYDNTD